MRVLMSTNLNNTNSILDAASISLDLDTFLYNALNQTVTELECSGGSVFLFDGSNETLQLKAQTKCAYNNLHLEHDEGIVGDAIKQKTWRIYCKSELKQLFVEWGNKRNGINLKAIVTVPIKYKEHPIAVFCFDYKKNNSKNIQELNKAEKERAAKVANKLNAPRFANALNRIIINQTLFDIRASVDGTSRLWQAVAEYLNTVLESFIKAGKPKPDIAYLQLVDRRRDIIRTVQGVGMPLSFQLSISHSLKSSDIQVNVVKQRCPIIIVGKDPSLNPYIFDRFNHDKYVRLWLPLFPFPISRLVHRPGVKIESLLSSALRWEKSESLNRLSKRRVAQWHEEKLPAPPERLIYGTLELGYTRRNRDMLSFEPFDNHLASWCAAVAYKYSEPLFRATLPGTIDSIAKAVAKLAWPSKTNLTVAMANWNNPEVRSFPTSSFWPAVEPVPCVGQYPSPDIPAKFDLINCPGNAIKMSSPFRDRLLNHVTNIAEEAIRLSMRLDDHAAELYNLIEDAARTPHVGTEYPNQDINDILQEICREATAEKCIMMVFEKKQSPPSSSTNQIYIDTSWNMIGSPQWWPSYEDNVNNSVLTELATGAANTQTTNYTNFSFKNRTLPLAVLPLELEQKLQAIILLLYPQDYVISESRRRSLEGRITRWVYRLSLKNLKTINHFTKLMRILRTGVMDARINAAKRDSNHLHAFVEDLFNPIMEEIQATASILTLYSQPQTGPEVVERFWCCEDRQRKGRRLIDRDIFIGNKEESPCSLALKTHDLGIYRKQAHCRTRSTDGYIGELLKRAQALGEGLSNDRSRNLYKLIDQICEEDLNTTMIVVPIENHADPQRKISGALSFVLQGVHDLHQMQQDLVLELGTLIADTLDQLRKLDESAFERAINEGFEKFRKDLSNSSTHDEVFGCLLKIVGTKMELVSSDHVDLTKRWSLSNHAIAWLLTPGYRELVARSGRGQSLDMMNDHSIFDPSIHPLLSKEIKSNEVPRKQLPSIDQFRIWTIDLHSESAQNNPVLSRYKMLPNCHWLISFPLIYADNRVVGVIDCPRDKPLRPEEESVLRNMLRRLSFQVCAAFDRCKFERAIKVARELTDVVGSELEAFRVPTAYKMLVAKVRDEIGMTHCDLFMDRDGKMILVATTRYFEPISEDERQTKWVTPAKGSEVLGASLEARAVRISHGSSTLMPMDHLSSSLQLIMSADHKYERIAIPIGKKPSPKEPIPGILYLCGPMSSKNQGRINRQVKKSGLVTNEHLRRAQDLTVVVYRNAMMARLVERKGWLIDEMQHAMGQPLHALRHWSDMLLREIAKYKGVDKNAVRQFKINQNRGFQLVHEARSQLAIYAKMSRPIDTTELSNVSLNSIVQKTCDFLSPTAAMKNCYISYTSTPVPPIIGYEALLHASIFNLVDNAIKYSYEGRQIAVSLQDDGKGCLLLTVENYGVGIPKPDLPRVFEPYFRSKIPDEKGARKGCGIGLAIVRHAIEIVHKGKVNVFSQPPRHLKSTLTATEVARYPHKTTFAIKMFLNSNKTI